VPTSPKAGKTHEQAREESRKALLDAGAALLVETAQRNPFGALRVRAVCERAGRSSGAFYMHWKKADAYHQALGEYLLLGEPAVFSEDFERMQRLARDVQDLPPRVAIRSVAQLDLESLLKSDSWQAVELLNVTWARDRLRDAAIRGYREVDDSTAETYEIALSRSRREPRPPLTMRQVGAVLQAFVEGFGLRCKVDPEGIGGEMADHLYAVGVAALSSALTRQPGDRRTVDEVLDEVLGQYANGAP
jgi:AcrR family transcriptional regulator